MEKTTIAKMLKKIRTELEYTQKELGELCNMKDSQIRRYENGHAIPKAITLDSIVSHFDILYFIEEKKGGNFFTNIFFNTDNEDVYYFNCTENVSLKFDFIQDKEKITELKQRGYPVLDANYERLSDYPTNILQYTKKYVCSELSTLDKIILNKAKKLNDNGKQKAIDYMDDLAQMPKYKK